MRVAQDDGIEGERIERERREVADFGVATALKEATVDEDPLTGDR
jgi:hypothetical protein